ncbi:MAG: TonB-dependent receptor plug domain-containing protein [Alistipes sp.]|nr:TonB-dependent receptor plug domain-containing protein [Alistipes sp.]
MKRCAVLFLASVATFCVAVAGTRIQRPLCIVNGTPTSEDVALIPPEDIERIETLPADEETIARYGEQASNGVILLTLRYDEPARFCVEGMTFGEYIARQVKWADDEPVARVVLRYTVTPEGRTVIAAELESTDNRLKRRVLKAVEGAPNWIPAMKNGQPVASEGVLRVQLPDGKRMPRPMELVIR